MAARFDRVVRHCDWCDTETNVDVETLIHSSDCTTEMWRCLECGFDHHNEFFQGDDD